MPKKEGRKLILEKLFRFFFVKWLKITWVGLRRYFCFLFLPFPLNTEPIQSDLFYSFNCNKAKIYMSSCRKTTFFRAELSRSQGSHKKVERNGIIILLWWGKREEMKQLIRLLNIKEKPTFDEFMRMYLKCSITWGASFGC